jgi:AcrR family transcriptional regulator
MTNSNTKPGKEIWLEEGYRQFALYGPDNLNIKKISEAIDTSRASFYHYFGDIDVFTEELLAMHWGIVDNFNKTGKSTCQKLFPDLYNLLAEHAIPLQFSMQLFHHRSNPAFNYLFIKTYEASAKIFLLNLFVKQFALNKTESEVYDLWVTVGEAWYSRLTKDDLSASTLQKHAEEIMDTVIKFAESRLYSII